MFALWRYGLKAFRKKSGRKVTTVYLLVRTKFEQKDHPCPESHATRTKRYSPLSDDGFSTASRWAATRRR